MTKSRHARPRIPKLCSCGCPPLRHRNHGEGGYCFGCKIICAPFDAKTKQERMR